MSGSTAPLVTVLMPVRNGAAHLRESIDSILAQSFADFELLIIDDGSSDDTAAIIAAYSDPRIRAVPNPVNIGLVATLNRGLELARGALIARQDHDDVSARGRLEKQVAFLNANPEVVLVGTEAFATDAQGRVGYRILRPLEAQSIRWYLCFDNAFVHSSVMFRRDAIRTAFGAYSASLHSEDYALWSRVAASAPTANLGEPLVYYREHVGSVTGGMSGADTAQFGEVTAALRAGNLRELLGAAPLGDKPEVLTNYRRPLSRESARQYLAVFAELLATQSALWRTSRDFRRTVAVQWAELAYRLLPIAGGLAVRLYGRAFYHEPRLLWRTPWPRVLALLLLGDRARKLYTWLRGDGSR